MTRLQELVRGRAVDVVLAVAFLLLLARVATQSGPLALDARVTDALPPLHGVDAVALLSGPAQLVTDVGDPIVWTAGALLVALVAAWLRRSVLPLRIVALPVVVEAVLVLGLKAAVGRTGPAGSHPPDPFGYFPSGHTATAVVCTGALAALVAVHQPDWARAMRIGVAVWSVLIAAALLYCRYHWLTDVLGSLLLGALVLRLLCRPFWATADRSGDHPAPQHDPRGLREDV